jgi:hypothetical protein
MRSNDLGRDWLAAVTGGCGGEGNGGCWGAIDVGGCDDAGAANTNMGMGGGAGCSDLDLGCFDDAGDCGGAGAGGVADADAGIGGADAGGDVIDGCWGNAGAIDAGDAGGAEANGPGYSDGVGYADRPWSSDESTAAAGTGFADASGSSGSEPWESGLRDDANSMSGTSHAQEMLGMGDDPSFGSGAGDFDHDVAPANGQYESSPYGGYDSYEPSGGAYGNGGPSGVNGANEYGVQPGSYASSAGAGAGGSYAPSSDAYASATTVDYGGSAAGASSSGGTVR